jgi:hypothetical protein
MSRYFGQLECVKVIQQHRQGDLTLHEASAIGDFETLTRVVAKLDPTVGDDGEGEEKVAVSSVSKAAINEFSADGFTALTYACFFGDAPEVKGPSITRNAHVKRLTRQQTPGTISD